MPPTSNFPWANRLMGGKFADYLRDARDRKESFESIAFAIRQDYDLAVSSATLRRWYDDLDALENAG